MTREIKINGSNEYGEKAAEKEDGESVSCVQKGRQGQLREK